MDLTLHRVFSEGGTVITVNARLARSLTEGFGRNMQDAGRRAWLRPDVISFGAWISRWWDDFAASTSLQGESAPLLLSGEAELMVWERAIREDSGIHPILQLSRTAGVARNAYEIAAAWHIDFDGATHNWTDDVQTFARWKNRFEEKCEHGGYVVPALLPNRLLEHLKSETARLPGRLLLLAGFDELTPVQASLFEALEAAGVTVERWNPTTHQADVRLLAADDAESELRIAARWARRQLELNDGRHASIGVVVPELSKYRNLAERIFTDVFCPGGVTTGMQVSERAFNLSAGRPLVSYPLVDAAFQIWNLGRGRISWEDVGRLVRSPFVAGGLSERESRSLLDARLRRRGVLTMTPGDLCNVAGHYSETEGDTAFACPLLAEHLAKALTDVDEQDRLMPPSEWIAVFLKLLEAMGWPGDRKLESEEFQTMMALRDVIGRLASLDETGEPVGFHSAATRLYRMCSEQPFQPRTGAAPVQIIGILEAGGLTFDALWITGLHDEGWPAGPSPNPFLPLDQQKKKKVPHASAERELDFARAVLGRLVHAAPHVVASYPTREEDRELKPSRLLSEIAPVTPAELNLYSYESASQLLGGAVELEEVEDFRGPPLEDGTTLRGGSRVFELQAKCPFRAYAEIRLNAERLETPSGGFDAREKGTLVHLALKKLWERIGSQSALVDREDIDVVVQDAIHEALAERRRQRPECYSDRLAEVEQRRLEALFRVLLDQERQRRPFDVVDCERRRKATVGGLTVETVVDRIDRLEDGRVVFIDYKTGEPKVNSWLGDRPDEPQVPLYAVTSEEEVAAAAFLQVNARDVVFCGFQSEQGIAPRLKIPGGQYNYPGSWDELYTGWQAALDRLGREHGEGDARVDPKHPNQTCRYCPQTAFCRKHELLALNAEEENENE